MGLNVDKKAGRNGIDILARQCNNARMISFALDLGLTRAERWTGRGIFRGIVAIVILVIAPNPLLDSRKRMLRLLRVRAASSPVGPAVLVEATVVRIVADKVVSVAQLLALLVALGLGQAGFRRKGRRKYRRWSSISI